MAGLNPRTVAPRGRERSRGQLLLVGAFGLAVLLLVLAGVLNTVTYTESLAAQGDSLHGGRDVAAFQEDARVTTRDLVTRANREDTTYSDKEATVEQSVTGWSNATRRYHARDVAATNATVIETTRGARLEQNLTSPRQFTNDSGASNWTLATGVSNTRLFRMQIEQGSLLSGNCGNVGCYTLVVEGDRTWTVSLNQSAVVVDGPDTRESCPVQGDPVVVNVTAGTVDGQECEALSFLADLADYDISYRYGENAEGTYRLTVDGSPVNGNFGDPPSASPAIYDVSVRVTYRTPSLTYDTTIRIARGEADG